MVFKKLSLQGLIANENKHLASRWEYAEQLRLLLKKLPAFIKWAENPRANKTKLLPAFLKYCEDLDNQIGLISQTSNMYDHEFLIGTLTRYLELLARYAGKNSREDCDKIKYSIEFLTGDIPHVHGYANSALKIINTQVRALRALGTQATPERIASAARAIQRINYPTGWLAVFLQHERGWLADARDLLKKRGIAA